MIKSYVLYFEVESNEYLKKLQKEIYEIKPVSKYNPETFKFHITIHIDKAYDKIISMQEKLRENFEEFILNVEDIGLYEIYPAKLVE